MTDLGRGYVRLVDSMGTDLTVVNAARVSFEKESAEMTERDGGLIRFLLAAGHGSTLRHNVASFEVYAPLMVARQWQKYLVASTHTEDQQGWNESSRRYVTEIPRFYIPGADAWRSIPETRKQGSGEALPADQGVGWTQTLMDWVDEGTAFYDAAMAAGICAEQARLFLPAYGMFIRWRWTISLQGLLHFLDERLEAGAQDEIRDYAAEVERLVAELWPVVIETWRELK